MTSTRASAVPRSRINRGGCCHAAPPRRARRNTVRPRLASPRWSAGAGAAGCRVRRSRRGPMWRSGRGVLAGPAAEEAEEIAFRRQDERGVLAVQRIAIGLQRAVKGKEFFVLPERIGIDLDRLTVAVAAIMVQIRDDVAVQAKDFGIDVVDVRLRRADLPEENSQAIYARMQSE